MMMAVPRALAALLMVSPFAAALPAVGSEQSTQSISETRTLSEAGSIAKFACTIAILRLSDEGQLGLDDPVGALVPTLADLPAGRVKLRHVLANRSGIADGLAAAARADVGAVMAISDPAEAALRFGAGDLIHEPGSAWSYDLINWMIAQAVIEQVTGEELDQALSRLVLGPAGMLGSRVFAGFGGPDLAKPLVPSRPLPRFLQCAGGLVTNPDDLELLVRFPHRGALSKAAQKELSTVTTPEESYTLGGRFRVTDRGALISWQSGSNGSYRSFAVYDVGKDEALAGMTANANMKRINELREVWLAER